MIGAILGLGLFLLGLAMCLWPVWRVLWVWAAVDVGVVAVWVASSIVYVIFLKWDPTGDGKCNKDNFANPGPEIHKLNNAANASPARSPAIVRRVAKQH